MKRSKLFKIISITSPILLVPCVSTTITSCKSDLLDNIPKHIDGSNWGGRRYGTFTSSDYIINDEEKTVTYWNGRKIKAHNLVIPNYVLHNAKKYKVIIGQQCFWQARDIYGSVEFNDFMTEVPDDCFNDAINVQELIMHEYPTRIGDYAFYYCGSLTTITVTKSGKLSDNDWTMKVKYIGDFAFESTRISGDLNFNSSIEYIGERAFMHCMDITQLRLDLTGFETISTQAFSNCIKLTDVYLPESMQTLGNNSFANCTSLTTIHLPKDGMKLKLGNFALYNCRNFESFDRPCELPTIGEACFFQNTSLKFRPWEWSVNSIGKNAFASCHINSLEFSPDYEIQIDDSAFSDCLTLKAIDFKAYKKNDGIPSWTGKDIFASPVGGGILIVSQEVYDDADLWNDWLEFIDVHLSIKLVGEKAWTIQVE